MLAGIFLLNQYFRLPGHVLTLVSRSIVIVGLAPIALYAGLPDSPVFYIAVSVTGAFAAYGDIRIFNLCARYGGGVVSRLLPLIIWVAFMLWLVLRPETMQEYTDRPLRALGIMAALGGCAWFSFTLQKCPVSRAAFIALVPVILMFGTNQVLAKIAMDNSGLHSGVFAYLLWQSALVVVLVSIARLAVPGWFRASGETRAPRVARDKILLAGCLMAFFWSMQMVLKNYAFTFAPNPSYVAALNETAPVWVMLFYIVIRHREDGNILSGLGIMASAIALSLLTTH